MDEAIRRAMTHLREQGYSPTRAELAALWRPFLEQRSASVRWQSLARWWVEAR
jgi:hypothetical protein